MPIPQSNAQMDLVVLVRLMKEHAERNTDTTLLALAAKAEVLAEQQTTEVVKLHKKVAKLKQKLAFQLAAPPRPPKAPVHEYDDCYVAPSYLSVQNRELVGSGLLSRKSTPRHDGRLKVREDVKLPEDIDFLSPTRSFNSPKKFAFHPSEDKEDELSVSPSENATTYTESSCWSIAIENTVAVDNSSDRTTASESKSSRQSGLSPKPKKKEPPKVLTWLTSPRQKLTTK